MQVFHHLSNTDWGAPSEGEPLRPWFPDPRIRANDRVHVRHRSVGELVKTLALIVGSLLMLFVPASYVLKLDVPVFLNIALLIVGAVVAYASRLSDVLEGKHLKLPGGVEIDDKESK